MLLTFVGGAIWATTTFGTIVGMGFAMHGPGLDDRLMFFALFSGPFLYFYLGFRWARKSIDVRRQNSEVE